jgi:hypothetical protein
VKGVGVLVPFWSSVAYGFLALQWGHPSERYPVYA